MKSIPLTITAGHALRIQVPAAHIIIARIAAGQTPRMDSKKPEQWHHEEKNGDTLLDMSHLPMWKVGDQSCRLFVPDDISLQVQMNAGHIRAEGLRLNALDLDTESGHIGLRDVSGRMHLRTAMGAINAHNISGSVEAETNMGEIKLGILGLAPGDHYVRANMGAIRVWLARGLSVRVESQARVGAVRSRFPSDPAAEAVLHLRADVGSIRLREADDAPPEPRDWLDPEAWLEWAALKFAPPRPPQSRPFPPFFGAQFAAMAGCERSPPRQSHAPIDETELRRILDLVKEKKISIEEAEHLISALDH